MKYFLIASVAINSVVNFFIADLAPGWAFVLGYGSFALAAYLGALAQHHDEARALTAEVD